MSHSPMKKKQLRPGEYVIAQTRAHGSVLGPAIFRFFCIFLILVALWGALARNKLWAQSRQTVPNQTPWDWVSQWLAAHHGVFGWIILGLGLVAFLVLIRRVLIWNRARYIFTSQRIIDRSRSLQKSPQLDFNILQFSSSRYSTQKKISQKILGGTRMIFSVPSQVDIYTGQQFSGASIELKNVAQADEVLDVLFKEKAKRTGFSLPHS